MKYRNKAVKDAHTEELLFEIIQRIGTADAPHTKRLAGDWEEGTVGIGQDHTATVLLPVEDKEVLYDIVAELDA